MYKCIVKQIEEGTFRKKSNTKHDKLFEKSKTWRQFKQPEKFTIHEAPNDMIGTNKTLEFFSHQRITAPKFDYKEPKTYFLKKYTGGPGSNVLKNKCIYKISYNHYIKAVLVIQNAFRKWKATKQFNLKK